MAGRCDCSKNCACAFRPSGSIAVNGSGAASQPLIASVRRRSDPANLLQVFEATDPSPGAAVYMALRRLDGTLIAPSVEDGSVTVPPALVKTAGGTVIAPDVEGAVVLPAVATPVYGQGLTIDVTAGGALVPNVANVWPQNDLQGSAMAGAITDLPVIGGKLVRSADGLFGPPEHTSIRAGGGDVLSGAALTPIPTTGFTTGAGTVWSLTNPSLTRRMLVLRSMVATVQISTPVNGFCRVDLQARISGGAYATVRSLHWPMPTTGTQAIQFEGELTKAAGSIIAAGASHSVQLRVVCTKEGAGGDPIYVSASAAVELFGVTI